MKPWFEEMFFTYSAKRRFTFLLISSMFIGLSIDASEYGAPCNNLFSGSCPYPLKCVVDFKCQCNEILTDLVYAPDGTAICQYHFEGAASIFRNTSCVPGCTLNQECVKGRCKCIEGYVMSQDIKICHKVIDVKPMDRCEVRVNAMLCDRSLFSTCKNSKCICFQNYYYNFTSEKCLEKPSGYKGLYNEYCSLQDDCLDGLHCGSLDSYRCKCPSSCTYKEEFGACDCGEVYVESPTLVIVIGCIIGICSVIFWIYVINRTYKKASNESNSCDVGEDNPLDSIPPGNTFPIDQPVNQYDKPNSIVDEPPTYKEAVFSSPTAPVGFNANNTSIMDEDNITKNCAAPYVPYFPAPQSNYQDSQNVSSASVGNLPYPLSAVTPTAPSLTAGQAPYPVSSQIPTTNFANTATTSPYPLSPLQDIPGKAQ